MFFFFCVYFSEAFCIQFGLRFSYNFCRMKVLKTIAEYMGITFYDLLYKITKKRALIGRLACLHEGM